MPAEQNLMYRLLFTILSLCAFTSASAQSPAANPWLHLSADTGVEWQLGGQVSRWNDTRGGAHPFVTQDNASNMPTYDSVGLGGRPAFRFDGRDSLSVASGMPTGSYTKVIAFSVEDFAFNNNVLAGATGHSVFLEQTNLPRVWHATSNSFVTSTAGVIADEPILLIATYDSSTNLGSLYLGGVLVGTGNGVPNADTSLDVGAFNGLQGLRGSIAEVLVYDRVLNGAERFATQAYLENLYTSASVPVVEFDQLPRHGQLFQRNLQGEGELRVAGTVMPGAMLYDTIEVCVTRGGMPWQITAQRLTYNLLGGGAGFDLTANIDAELFEYELSVKLIKSGSPTVVAEREYLVSGDAFLFQGQSNAIAADLHREDPSNPQGSWVRSFGSAAASSLISKDLGWGEASSGASIGHAHIGQLAMQLASDLVTDYLVPIAFINGGVRGTNSFEHLRNGLDPEDLGTIYGRLLWRAREAGIKDTARGLFWYQGESDGEEGANHAVNFSLLHDDWLSDFGAVERIFAFQVRQCDAMETMAVREIQRNLAREYGDVAVMSTTAAPGGDGCHFFNIGYIDLGTRMARIVARDLYGSTDTQNIDPPDLLHANWVDAVQKSSVLLTFRDLDDTLIVEPGAEAHVLLNGVPMQVSQTSVSGNTITLDLGAPSSATHISYVGYALTGPRPSVPPLPDGPWIKNSRGVGALAFFDVPILDCMSEPGVSYCRTSPNSAGKGALISGSGSPSIATNQFSLNVQGAPNSKRGFFFYGTQEGRLPFRGGFLCVGPAGGYHYLQLARSNFNGRVSQAVDFSAAPMNSGAGRVFPGATYYFQYCYFDSFAHKTARVNFSDGLRVQFCP